MKEHLQSRLKEKHNGSVSSHDSSSSGKCSSNSHHNGIGTEELEYLVKYIEGQPPTANLPNPKKAAKKERRKQRKV